MQLFFSAATGPPPSYSSRRDNSRQRQSQRVEILFGGAFLFLFVCIFSTYLWNIHTKYVLNSMNVHIDWPVLYNLTLHKWPENRNCFYLFLFLFILSELRNILLMDGEAWLEVTFCLGPSKKSFSIQMRNGVLNIGEDSLVLCSKDGIFHAQGLASNVASYTTGQPSISWGNIFCKKHKQIRIQLYLFNPVVLGALWL